MKKRWMVGVALIATVGLLVAQQPILLQDPSTSTNRAAVSAAGAVKVDGSAVTQPVSGTVTANAGTGPFPIAGSPQATSTYALTPYHSSSAAAANIKASAGNLYSLALGNSGNVPCWLQLFNNAGTPVAGTSVVDSIMVQAGVTVVIPAGDLAYENFSTGIAAAGATTDSGATTTGCTTTFSVSAYYK